MPYPRPHGAAAFLVAAIGVSAAMTAPLMSAEAADTLVPYVRADVAWGAGSAGGGGTIVDGPGFGNNFGTSVGFGGGFGVKLPFTVGPASFRLDGSFSESPSLGGGNHSGSLSDGTPISAPVKVIDKLFLATAYADLDMGWIVTPYVGIGAGGAQNIVKPIVFSNPYGSFAVVDRNSHTAEAWTATVGASYPFYPGFNLDVGYRYVRAGNVRSGGNISDITTSPPSAQALSQPIESSLSLNQVTVSVRYTF
jgi:opacity protein-like surface antigen